MSDAPPFRLRPGVDADLPFLEAMLFEAFHWRPDAVRPDPDTFFRSLGIDVRLADWRHGGDRSVIAERDGAPIGAAWYRFWTAERHGYGFVDEDTPELGIAVRKAHRGQGVGRALLRALIDEARRAGCPGLSLSVEPENFARRLYVAEGFVHVGASGTSDTMLLRF